MEGRPLEDRALVDAAQRGQVDAYEELVRRYQGIAHRVAYIHAGEEAEDAVQNAFVKAFFALDRFRKGEAFKPWLLTIVANEARNRARATRRRAAAELRLVEDRPPDDAAPSPERTVLGREPFARVLDALKELSERDRLVIAYRYLLDLSEAEMAQMMGCSKGTVKSRLSRALARLRLKLPDDALGEGP